MKLSTGCAALAVVVATLPPPAWATDTTYALSSAFLKNPSAVTLSGTITTDGVIGDVQSSDIVSYDITAVFDSNTIEETNSNSTIYIYSWSGGLTATAKNLTFDFSAWDGASVQIESTSDYGTICIEDANQGCTDEFSSDLFLLTNDDSAYGTYPASSDTIGTVPSSAPEPAIWTMMLIGVGSVLRRRRAALFAT